jgi:hypothetical protein
VHALHERVHDVIRYLCADGGCVDAGEAEVETAVDPSVLHLLDRRGEGREVPPETK